MRAVWSFWSTPHRQRSRWAWTSELYHALSWALSVRTASRHYPDTWLYTDDAGAEYLVDRLGIRFAHVSTQLNDLADQDPDWWALGKLYTYRAQTEPFVHIDCDAFLWLPLPRRLERAEVFAQSPEPFEPGASFYQPERIESAILGSGERLPKEWSWYRSRPGRLRGECCGIYGGCHVGFLRYVAGLAIGLLEDPRIRVAMATLEDKPRLMVVLEQFLPAASVSYHGQRHDSPFHGVRMEYLVNETPDLFRPGRAASLGFTHLLGGVKRMPAVTRLLEDLVYRHDRRQYDRCVKAVRAPR
ncbi:MAG: hypothetical protein PVF91_06325 [Chromatiales bacterium]|jgi:hypothetical protein